MHQKLTICGHLGRDPEMRHAPSGQAVTSFNVATNRKWTGSDGQPQEETVWFKVSAWGRQAETCNQYLHKGSLVLVEGRLSVDKETGGPRIWTDQSGAPRATYEMTAQEVKFLGGGHSSDGSDNVPEAMTEEEIPF